MLWVDHKDRALLSPPLSARYSVVYRRYAQNAPENITLCIYLPIYIKNNKCSVFVYVIVFYGVYSWQRFFLNEYSLYRVFFKKIFYFLNTIWCLFRCIECPIRQKDCVKYLNTFVSNIHLNILTIPNRLRPPDLAVLLHFPVCFED